jgi:hypothetical protein
MTNVHTQIIFAHLQQPFSADYIARNFNILRAYNLREFR